MSSSALSSVLPAGPLIGSIPRGTKLGGINVGILHAGERGPQGSRLWVRRRARSTRKGYAPAGRTRLPKQYRARRARWTLPGYDTRPGSGSECLGAYVCKLRAPEMDGRNLRQTRGMERGVPSLFSLSFGYFSWRSKKSTNIWGTPAGPNNVGRLGKGGAAEGASEPAHLRAGEGYVACGNEATQEKYKHLGAPPLTSAAASHRSAPAGSPNRR